MEFKINKNYDNIRDFLKEKLLLSKKNIHTITMAKDGIFVNDEIVNAYTPLNIGDRLNITISLSKSNYTSNSEEQITIEYEDDFLLIVSKPFGMKTHPNDVDNENNTLVNYLIGNKEYLEPIHRLDSDTCGLVIFAKTPYIKAKLDYLLENKDIIRYYSAIVKKEMYPQKIVANIGRDNKASNKMTVTNNGKEAITNIVSCTPLSNGYYRLVLSLETGRTHQIRVHLQHKKNSIVGDRLYSVDGFTFDNMYLGALKLEFPHPITNEKIVVQSKYQDIFDNIKI